MKKIETSLFFPTLDCWWYLDGCKDPFANPEPATTTRPTTTTPTPDAAKKKNNEKCKQTERRQDHSPHSQHGSARIDKVGDYF